MDAVQPRWGAEAKNNRQNTPTTSQNAAVRGSADRRECCPAPLLTYRPAVLFFIMARVFTASLGAAGAHRRFLLLVGLHTAADPALGGPADHLPALPGEDRSSRPDQPGGEADQASRQRLRQPFREAPGYWSARGASACPPTGQTAQPYADSAACSWFVQCLHRYSWPRRNTRYIARTAGFAPVTRLVHLRPFSAR